MDEPVILALRSTQGGPLEVMGDDRLERYSLVGGVAVGL